MPVQCLKLFASIIVGMPWSIEKSNKSRLLREPMETIFEPAPQYIHSSRSFSSHSIRLQRRVFTQNIDDYLTKDQDKPYLKPSIDCQFETQTTTSMEATKEVRLVEKAFLQDNKNSENSPHDTYTEMRFSRGRADSTPKRSVWKERSKSEIHSLRTVWNDWKRQTESKNRSD